MNIFNFISHKYETKVMRREIWKNIDIISDYEIKPLIHQNYDEIDEISSKKKIFGFIQLKLDIDFITKEFEDITKERIRQKGIIPKIKYANYTDIPCILDLYNRSFMTANTPLEKITIENLEELYNIPEVSIYIAKVYGLPAGFMILDFEGNNNEYGFILALGIIPRFQSRGVGLALGLKAWNHFKEKNIKELRCEVYYRNEKSISFLKSLRFKEFAIR